jgi:hypothetical protein
VKNRTLLSVLAVALFLLALNNPAVCQSLNLNDICTDFCGAVSSGGPYGGPASGSADFSEFGQAVTFTFETNAPLWYHYSQPDGTYNALFGYGGTFELTSPYGTFNGVVTSGSSNIEPNFTEEEAGITFTGYWNTGLFSAGTAYVEVCGDCLYPGTYIGVVLSTTPEPSTLVLFGSAVLGLGLMRRRLTLR